MATPIKISIITVVYNGEAVIEGTIKSVLEQTYQNIEYILVDGQSTDNTLNIIKKYQANIDQWINEADNGLYDAMNKGLAMATGDFVWFMNAGDSIFNRYTVEQMVKKCQADTDVLFGEVMLVNEQRKHLGTRTDRTTQKLPATLHWKSLQMGMVVCHQGFLPRRNIAPKYALDNLAADIDWVIECLKKSRRNTHTQLILAEYLQGGISKQRHRQSLQDRFKILNKQYGVLPNLMNHLKIVTRKVVSSITN